MTIFDRCAAILPSQTVFVSPQTVIVNDHADVVDFQTIGEQIERNDFRTDERRQVVGACAGDWRREHAGTVE